MSDKQVIKILNEVIKNQKEVIECYKQIVNIQTVPPRMISNNSIDDGIYNRDKVRVIS